MSSTDETKKAESTVNQTPDAAPATSENNNETPAAEESARATVRRSTMPPAATEGTATDANGEEVPAGPVVIFLTIEAPSGKSVKVETTPADCILDVRQFLLECPETAEYTSYHLEASFGPLNDYYELQHYPQLCQPTPTTSGGAPQPPVLKIVPDLYDERGARLHVRRLRELLVKPPAHIQPSVIQAGYEDAPPQPEKAVVASSASSAAASKGGKKGGKKGKKGAAKDDFLDEFAAPQSTDAPSKPLPLVSTYTDTFSLNSFHAISKQRAAEQQAASLVESVRNISFSGWNPPPGNRKLQGDLLYLELTTSEGTSYHITSNQEGFFVNQSTHLVFNPDRAESHHKSLTLIELLKKLSPSFAHKYNRACQRKITQHPFEAMELPTANQLSHQWLAQAKPHTYDQNRSEDSLLNTYGMDNRGLARDWNEEYQSCRELPKSTPAERIVRDRTMYRVYSDFVDAATKGAVAVVHGHIPPVNPMDQPRAFVFIYNQIFFSFAVDERELADTQSSDRVSYQTSNQDMLGVKAYSSLDIDDLYTLATVLIDYRGHRVIAQSILPGVFHGDRASKHVYGSMDQGKTIEANEKFHQLMVKAAEKLHIKPHTVLDGKGEKKELAACVESKGIIGSDGRSYILDLLRAFPRDANFLATAEESTASSEDGDSGDDEKKSSPLPHNSCLLRPELLAMYCHTKAFSAILPSAAEQAKKDVERRNQLKAKLVEMEADAVKTKGSPLTDEERLELARKIEDEDVDDQRADVDAQYAAQLDAIKFNPDAFTGVKLGDAPEEIARDEDRLKELARFLKEEQLHKLVKQLQLLEISPVDTQHFTSLLHEHGINMRYLSHIIKLAQSLHLPHIEAMAQQECIVRASKHIFNAFLRNITPERNSSVLKNKQHVNSIDNLYFAPLIAKFLNSLFGTQALGHKISAEQMTAAATIVAAQREEESRERREAAAAAQATVSEEEEAAATATAANTEEKEAAPALSKGQKKKAKANKKAASSSSGDASAAAAATTSTGPVSAKDMEIRLGDGSRAPTDPLSPANLWTLVRMTVMEKFQYELPAYLPMTARSKLCMLRSFCLKTGVQLQCKDYDLTPTSKNAVPFTVADVLDIFPVVKANLPVSSDARELLENGKAFLQQGNFGAAYQLLSESLNVHHQVYGPMHVDTANVYATLALTCFQVGDVMQSVDFQQRAIIIYERVLGLDSYESAHAHLTQSLFLQQIEHIHASMKHMSRALFIFELIAGPNHPDTAAAHMNAAHNLLNSAAFIAASENGRDVRAEGLKHLETALERNQIALDPDHAQVALTYHAVAVAHAFLGDFRAAVTNQKMSKAILLNSLDPKDREVLRSHCWLEHFTALAVKVQQSQNRMVEGATKGKKGAAAAAAAQAAAQLPRMPILPPQAIIPPQLKGLSSPLTWVSLHSQVMPKGKLSMSDVMQLLEASTKATESTATEPASAGEQKEEAAPTAEATTASA